MVSLWETLGIAATRDEAAIRKAYAARAREWRPDSHPKEFARLREAYEAALRLAREPQPVQPEGRTAEPEPAPEARPYAMANAMVSELARCYSEAGEREAVALLHRQFHSLAEQTVDARLEWELVFLHSLLSAQSPPVALLFEGDRLLRWRERPQDVSQMSGEQGAQRLGELLELAGEAIYARHFSPNKWHARLFGFAGPRWFGWTPHVADARRTIAYWRRMAQSTGVASLEQALHPVALRRLEGRMLLSTDALLAAVIALIVWLQVHDPLWTGQPWKEAGLAALAFTVALPVPWLARWSRSSRLLQGMRGWRYLTQDTPGMIWFIAGAVLFGIGMVFVLGDTPPTMRVVGWVLVASTLSLLASLIVMFVWLGLYKAELLLAWPVLWLQRTWGVHAFLQVREDRGLPSWQAQLRRLPQAAGHSWKQARAQRKVDKQRQAQQRQVFSAATGTGFNWWWIAAAIALINGLSHLLR